MKRDSVARTFSIIAIVLSIVALVIAITSGISTCGRDINYVGVIVGLMGVCATFMVGYQIWNTIDVKESIKKNEQVAKEFDELKRSVESNNNRAQENLDIMQSLIAYQGQMGLMSTSEAVIFMHHAILSALNSDRKDFSYIFDCIMLFTNELTELSITGSNMSVLDRENEKLIQDKRSPYYGQTVRYAINDFLDKIMQTDVKIREHERYSSIQSEYDRIMIVIKEKLKELETT